MNRLFRDVPPVNNHRWGSSRLIRAPVLVVDLLTSLGVTPPPCPVTPAEYLPNQPYGAHADSNRIVNMQLYVICKSFYGCSASMLITGMTKAWLIHYCTIDLAGVTCDHLDSILIQIAFLRFSGRFLARKVPKTTILEASDQ